MELLARIGSIAYGVVHLLVGWIALQIAWGGSRRPADTSGALGTLAAQPFGRVMLWLVAIGLIGLAAWQLTEAVQRHYPGSELRKRRKQLTGVAKAVIYASLGVSAAKVALGGGSSSGRTQQKATAGVLAWPGGQLIVVVVAAVVIGVGVATVAKGVRKSFLKELETARMTADVRRGVTRLGQVGYIAKGIALGVVGALLGYAAITFDPAKASGLDGALQTILAQPFGRFLLTAVALGLAAFGLFAMAQARYRRM